MIDEIQLNFNPTTLFLLNCILGFILYGVAIELKLEDFRRITKMPKEILVGLSGQLILLPAITGLLIYFIQPHSSLALGMILVASCPGGNLSNFLTHRAKGNTSLSVTLTTLATILTIFFTPFNFYFWGNILPSTREALQHISVPILGIVINVFVLIALPLALGLFTAKRFPSFVEKIKKPIKWFSLAFFGVFVLLALANNWTYFLEYISLIFVLVVLHNAAAFVLGYGWASIFGISLKEKKAITLEVGLQNSGLGLILIFTFFNGMGGMALIAAFWGIWHIVTGFSLAYWFKNKKAESNSI